MQKIFPFLFLLFYIYPFLYTQYTWEGIIEILLKRKFSKSFNFIFSVGTLPLQKKNLLTRSDKKKSQVGYLMLRRNRKHKVIKFS